MKIARMVGIGMLVLSLSAGVLYAAPGNPQGPKPKLAAPANVTCPLTVDGVVVSFDAVEGAAGYQVEFLCVNALGEFRLESTFAPGSPVPLVEEDCTIISLHVRALTGHPVHEDGPLAAGMKGEWSDPPCVVEPVLPSIFQ